MRGRKGLDHAAGRCSSGHRSYRRAGSGLAAAGRCLWPNGDRGLNERLYRIKAPTLLLWGESDRIIPPVYADAFRRLLVGACSVRVQTIAAAGHALFAEQPQAMVKAIVDFCAY